jgi:ABC-type lipoprotein export system ATPase subunit
MLLAVYYLCGMFALQQVVPAPLYGQTTGSGVWGHRLTLEPSRKYLVRAPSGKGKSTFLHLLYGLRLDYRGEITWQGKETRLFSPDAWADLRRDQLAMVFQDLRLFPHLSAWENLLLKNQLTGFFPEAVLRQHAERLGMGPFLTQKAETLSYGQRQRIAIVRALAQPFRYLMLDEPFSHLDLDNARLARELIDEQVGAQGATLVVASLGEDYGWTFTDQLTL